MFHIVWYNVLVSEGYYLDRPSLLTVLQNWPTPGTCSGYDGTVSGQPVEFNRNEVLATDPSCKCLEQRLPLWALLEYQIQNFRNIY
jgi:hypothetical protein